MPCMYVCTYVITMTEYLHSLWSLNNNWCVVDMIITGYLECHSVL